MTTALDSWTRPQSLAREPMHYELADLIELSERMAGVQGFVPSALLNRPPAVLATMLAGHALGLDPMVSLRAIFVIEGRVALSAEIARALVFAAGHSIMVDVYEDQEVTVRGKRRDERDWSLPISWTWSRAERAKLTGRQNWQRYPRQMLAARATSELGRLKFPDALAGLEVVADEEAHELMGFEEPAAEVEEKPRKGSTRRAGVKAAPLVAGGTQPSPEEARDSLPPADVSPAPTVTPSVPAPTRESVAGDAPLVLPVDEAPPPSVEPEEPDPEVDAMLAEVHQMRENLDQSQLPQWQRKLHAQVGELFVGASPETRDAYRHAMVAVLTRGRDGGPVQSSSELDEAERAGFSAMLNNIKVGDALIARLENGMVELRKGGWCYRVRFEPLEVKAYREAG